MPLRAPDLTQRPPRSPRVRLGGFVILPRLLDKGRASLIGKNGDYHFNCPLDQHFVKFAGIDIYKLKEQLELGKGDQEMLEWIRETSTLKPNPWDITAWSNYQELRCPSDMDTRHYFSEYQAKIAPERLDVTTWFELLDLDDYVSFGGEP